MKRSIGIIVLTLLLLGSITHGFEKPDAKTIWTNATPGNRLEPGGSKKNTGYIAGERPGFKTWNWLIYNLGLWTDYLEDITDTLKISTTGADGYIGETGNVGIGTSTPTVKAHIVSTGTGTNAAFQIDTAQQDKAVFVSSSGVVEIASMTVVEQTVTNQTITNQTVDNMTVNVLITSPKSAIVDVQVSTTSLENRKLDDAPNVVVSTHIAPSAVDTNEINNDAVDKDKINADVVDDSTLEQAAGGELQVKALGVDTAQLAASAVETAKINNDAVDVNKLAHNVDATGIGFDADKVDGKHETFLKYDGSQVFTGASPAAWTDLDLSANVGSNRALVYLKVTATEGNMIMRFRTNGETAELDQSFGVTSNGNVEMILNHIVYFLVLTDASGIIEWKSDGDDANIDLLVYLVVN